MNVPPVDSLVALHPTSPVVGSESEVAYLAARLVALAETLGMLPRSTASSVDRNQIDAALDAFARAGVGRRSFAFRPSVTVGGLGTVLNDVLAAIEGSPMPEHEWVPLSEVLGDDQLAVLVGTSVSSLHRYRNGERATPDPVAARLHTVALITADLAGSYNDFGIRRWFQRTRAALGGTAPDGVLRGNWSPDDERVKEVRALASALLGSPAT